MSVKLVLNISANEGYKFDQVNSCVTVGELKDWLESYDDDVEIVTNDINNQYGANIGVLVGCEEA